ncbi:MULTISPECIES: ABC transporter permease [unclassified Hyphomonas]|jgi:ABC-2 type transport system permease protein|uniref:ABC transporter n=2 Tax=root TaxID=1 RepID=A0A1Y5I5D6_OSTTA|nr:MULTISPECIES: ABC transporter permease [unclassified Hyphomonas]MAN91323.1 multidrug ABC transporter permease [Hyphomonadaceae bacterium]OUS44729.1 ABC transporter [Ostreococcus tauri]MAA82162.1 multidrug ABC transporter permease [Hyphomonas sp.]MAL46282.1 multidrug ABC transporter permease [Hyphomonas sp.]MAX82976.1 multidrug ABC transporter permease [Hyphomonas sp.]|tara:strand:+ start:3046 stop:3882 length:837 start_codon:yes stop_codon:yes gene_type:complete
MTDTAADQTSAHRLVRQYGKMNGLGLWTLFKREIGRFLKVWMQTVFAPVVTTLLFMTVFKLAFGERGRLTGDFEGLSYIEFLAPGLIVMAILQNAFQNTSSSLVQAKFNSTYVDFLMPPLSPMELTIGFIGGSVVRGLLVAFISAIGIQLSGLADLSVAHVWPILWFSITSAIALGALGAIGGIWADKFDHLSAVTNFVIVPLTFLSGTFYDIKVMSEPFYTMALLDPFFYMIDGFRYGFLGVANSSVIVGVWVTGLLSVAGIFAVWLMFRSGYKLKA